MKDLKAAMRRDLRALRRSLTPTERSEQAAAAVTILRDLVGDAPLVSYLAMSTELDLARLHEARWATGRPVWLPRVVGEGLVWHPVRDPADCRPGAFGVLEPDLYRVRHAPLPPDAVMLVPGVAFDARGGRLGQGAGFYDRALANHPGLTIGVGFTCQEVPAVPCEAHDQPVHHVVLGGRRLR